MAIRVYVWGLVLSLASAAPARAQSCTSGPECIQRWVGPIPVNTTAALVTGVIAAPIILAGGAVTAVKMTSEEKPEPAGVIAPSPSKKKRRAELALIPTEPAPPPGRPLTPAERAAHERAVRVNDAMTTAAIAVGGAAVLTGIVYGIAKKK